MAISISKKIGNGHNYSSETWTNTNITVTFSSDCQVDIDEIIYKDLVVRVKGYSKTRYDQLPATYINDFKKLTHGFVLRGIISNTAGGDTALTKKKKMMAMSENGGLVTFTNETEVWNCNFRQVRFTNMAGVPTAKEFLIELLIGQTRT